MGGEFDRFVEWLERKTEDDARGAFSDKVVSEFLDPSNLERLSDPDARAIVTGPCGDTMEIYLLLDGEIVRHASFMTDGCGPTVACGSMLTKLLRGMPLADARSLEPRRLRDALGGLPPESEHCADLAIMTLRRAIADRDP